MVSGFSIVELLIVITIIAILTAIGAVYYFGIQAKTRDSARRANVSDIATALEVNKTLEHYVSLQINQFTSFQIVDPSGNAYCIATGIPQAPIVTTPWGQTCPSPFITVAPNTPSGTFTSWKVCTYLENRLENSNTNAFCRPSRQ